MFFVHELPLLLLIGPLHLLSPTLYVLYIHYFLFTLSFFSHLLAVFVFSQKLRIGLDQVHFLKASKSSAPWGTDSIVPFPFRGLFFIVPHCSCRRWLSPRSRSAKRIVFLSSLSPPGFSHFFPSATFPRTARMILISCFAFRRMRYFPP